MNEISRFRQLTTPVLLDMMRKMVRKAEELLDDPKEVENMRQQMEEKGFTDATVDTRPLLGPPFPVPGDAPEAYKLRCPECSGQPYILVVGALLFEDSMLECSVCGCEFRLDRNCEERRAGSRGQVPEKDPNPDAH